jgi:hypothetical protein
MDHQANRWTPAEYEIVRSNTVPEAVRLLPHRTREAIKFARKKCDPRRQPWTAAQDRKILKYSHEPLPKLARRFRGRTERAVRHRRHLLVGYLNPLTSWKTTELTKLRSLWPSATHDDIQIAFPDRSWGAIKVSAKKEGLHRPHRLAASANELRDAIRRRAREDGISFAKLGAQTACGSYFAATAPKTADLP